MKSGFFLLLKIADCLLDFLRIVEIGTQLNVLDLAKALLQFNAQNYLDLLNSHLSFSRANLGIDVLNDGVWATSCSLRASLGFVCQRYSEFLSAVKVIA